MIATAEDAAWWAGMSVGVVVIAVVVMLMAMVLAQAARIASQAHAAGDALERVRDRTDALHDVGTISQSATAVVRSVEAVRGLLTR